MKKYLSLLLFMMMSFVGYQASADMYVLGIERWDPTIPTAMTLNEDSETSYALTIELSGDVYFSFTAKTGPDWDAIKDYRIAAPTDGYEVTLGEEMQGNEYGVNVDNAFRLKDAKGKYTITIDSESRKVKVVLDEEILPEPFSGTIYIDKSSIGNIWTWDSKGNYFDAWPGKPISELDIADINGTELYMFTYSHEDATKPGLIFNDGTSQTIDLVPEPDMLYTYSGGTEVSITELPKEAKLFLIGSFNEWNTETMEPLTLGEDGKFTITKEMEKDAKFKLIDENNIWIGGVSEDGDFVVTKEQVTEGTELSLLAGDQGRDFVMPVAGEWTLTVDRDAMKMVIAGEWTDEPEPEPALYLIGSFNGWDKETKVAMTKGEEGKYVVEQAMDADAEFKFMDENGNWIGAVSEGVFEVTEQQFLDATPLNLTTPGENFLIPVAGTWTLTVDREAMTLVIGGEVAPDKYYLTGSFNNWNEEEMVEMTLTKDGLYVVTQEMEANAEFKFYRNDGKWYGGASEGNFIVTKEQVEEGTPLSLSKPGENFQIPVAGEWTLTLDPEQKTVVIAGEWVEGGDPEPFELTELWELTGDKVPAWGDMRQGWGMDKKFYINDKANKKVVVYDENGLTEEEYAGGTNCGIAFDEAGNILVSLAEFPNAWVCNGETPMFRVINRKTGKTAEFAIPADAATVIEGRQDFIGWAKGDLFDEGEIYITTAGMDTGTVYRLAISEGEVDEDNSYGELIDEAVLRDNMAIVSYVPGLDMPVFYYRGTAPVMLDSEEGVDGFLKFPTPALPNTPSGNIRNNSNHDYMFVANDEVYCLYTVGPEVGKYYDGFALAKMVETPEDESGDNDIEWQLLYEFEPTVSTAPNSCQGNWLSAQVDENGFYVYQYVPGLTMRVFRFGEEPQPPVDNESMYLIGSFNDWDEESMVLMEREGGNYTLTKELEAGVKFKFKDWSGAWFGGQSDGDFVVTKEQVEEGTKLALVIGDEGQDFTIPVAGTWTFFIDRSDNTLVISGEWNEPQPEPELYILGSFNEWDEKTKEALTLGEDGKFTITKAMDADVEFKLMDGEGNWIGGVSEGNFVVTQEQVAEGTELSLSTTGNNFQIPVEGEWTLTVDLENMKMVIAGEWIEMYTVRGKIVEAAPAESAAFFAPGEGKPIAGATVKLVNKNNTEKSYVGTTNEEGAYEVKVVKGNYAITVSAPGYLPVNKTVNVEEDVDMEDIALEVDPTGVNGIIGDKAVNNIKYVNMAGQVSDKAYEGVNVMVVTFNDGTKKVVKVIK